MATEAENDACRPTLEAEWRCETTENANWVASSAAKIQLLWHCCWQGRGSKPLWLCKRRAPGGGSRTGCQLSNNSGSLLTVTKQMWMKQHLSPALTNMPPNSPRFLTASVGRRTRRLWWFRTRREIKEEEEGSENIKHGRREDRNSMAQWGGAPPQLAQIKLARIMNALYHHWSSKRRVDNTRAHSTKCWTSSSVSQEPIFPAEKSVYTCC